MARVDRDLAIDEVRLYGEVLGVEEIEEDRDTAVEPAAPPKPIAALSFDETFIKDGEIVDDEVAAFPGCYVYNNPLYEPPHKVEARGVHHCIVVS